MNIPSTEARESLEAIETMVVKTRQAISNSGAYGFLIVWGAVWLIGFLANQFSPPMAIRYFWMGLGTIGIVLSVIIGFRSRCIIRRSSPDSFRARIAWFWLLLLLYCAAAIFITWPIDGGQLAMVIILFVMIGWLVLSLLLSLFPIGGVWRFRSWR